MKINKEKLYQLYMQEVEAICEVCDWKTNFTAEEVLSYSITVQILIK